MSPRTKAMLTGAAIGIGAVIILKSWILILIVLGVIAVPVAAYLMLDPSQRRKVRSHSRKRLGR